MTGEPLDVMPPAMLAALKADLAVAGRWTMIGVHTSSEAPETPPETPVPLPLHATVTLQCAARSLTLVAMLTIPPDLPAESVKVHYQGTPFVSDDTELIARIQSRIAPLIALRASELIAKLTAPLS